MSAKFALFLALALLLCACTPREPEPSPTAPTDPVPANTYLAEAFAVKDGFLTYRGDCPSRVGVDVSSHQGEIDWERVRGAGVEFAMIRAGFRGYSEGKLYEDEYFRANMEGALAAGLDVGVYFFSQAVTAAEAVEEAGFLMGLVKDYALTYPVVFDWERQSAESSRTKDTDGRAITECAAAFCSAVEVAGYLPMVYFSPNKAYHELELAQLLDWPFWLAHYTEDWAPTSFRYHFSIWQYSSKGAVDGIEGDVDLDLCLADFSAVRQPGPVETAAPSAPESPSGEPSPDASRRAEDPDEMEGAQRG